MVRTAVKHGASLTRLMGAKSRPATNTAWGAAAPGFTSRSTHIVIWMEATLPSLKGTNGFRSVSVEGAGSCSHLLGVPLLWGAGPFNSMFSSEWGRETCEQMFQGHSLCAFCNSMDVHSFIHLFVYSFIHSPLMHLAWLCDEACH